MDLGSGRLMSRSGEITLDFGGEERTFRLAIKQWEKVQEKCDAGPAEILARLAPPFYARQQGIPVDQIIGMGMLGKWRIHDIREVILQGLLGGGMEGQQAQRLVRDWVDDRPLIESASTAYEIVLASYIGPGDEDAVGESQAAPAASPTSPEAKSASEKGASMPSPEPSPASPPSSAT
jgi:hypothetical protein